MEHPYLYDLLAIALPCCVLLRFAFCGAWLLILSALAVRASTVKEFDIPGGSAEETLAEYSRQADQSLLFLVEQVEGRRTQPIRGRFTLREALRRMLAGSGLFIEEDAASEALMVRMIVREDGARSPTDRANARSANPETPTTEDTMSNDRSLKRIASRALLALFTIPPLSAQTATNPPEEPATELSPFVVNADQDTGYTATSTLAGTRLRSDLKDLGASISVVTPELLSDLAATDAGTLLSYTGNTEVGGVQGNFSGAEDAGDGRYYQNDARTNPQFNQRIRGLGSAALTRGFFLTDIPFDSYNTNRVEVSRGPNSLLFGIGNPGGVINNGTKQATHGKTFGQVVTRFDNFGSVRGEIDFNNALIANRLAFRVAAVDDHAKFEQKPAWNRDRRIFGAIDAVLLENRSSKLLGPTVLRINAEKGTSRGSPVETIPPSLAFTNWFEPFPASTEAYTGVRPASVVLSPTEGGTWRFQATYNPFVTNTENGINTNTHPVVFRHVLAVYNDANVSTPGTGVPGVEGMLGLLQWNPNIDKLSTTGLLGTPAFGSAPGTTGVRPVTIYHTNSPYAEGFAIGFAVPTIQNREIFDYRKKVYSGGVDQVKRAFDARNIALEQSLFGGRAGIEFAYDRQHYESDQDFFFTGGNGTSSTGPYDVYVDITEFLPNGQPNPNLGRAYTRVARPETRFSEIDRETFRITAFGELDFSGKDGFSRHFGRHRFTLLYDDFERTSHSRNHREAWVSDQIDIGSILAGNTLDHFRRPVNVAVYTSGSLLGLSSIDQVRLQQINIGRPQPGDQFNVIYADVGKTSPADRRVQTGPVEIARYLSNEGINRSAIKAKAVAWQSFLFNNHVVGLVGFRRDDTKSYGRASEAERGIPSSLPDGSWDPSFTRLAATPSLDESGDTVTWSAVARYPQGLLGKLPGGSDLRLHIAQSENFNPVGLRNDALGRAIAQPTGTTREYGITLSLDDDRHTLKLNWFETELKNASAGSSVNVPGTTAAMISQYLAAELAGIPFSEHLDLVANPATHPIRTYAQMYQAALSGLPAAVQEAVNPRFEDTDGDGINDIFRLDNIPSLATTTDQSARGFEIEFTSNPTRDWRIMLNASKQETISNNTAPVLSELVNFFDKNLVESGLGALENDPSGVGQLRTIYEPWVQNFLAPVRQIRSKDGTRSNEQRMWRVNLVTNYTFSSGRLNGFGVGGSGRWESKAATGYLFQLDAETGVPLPVLNQPYYDDGMLTADFWLSYGRSIMNDRVRWKIQLNIRNALGNSDDIPVKTNPDGTVAVIRIPNPTTFYLTNTFKF